MGHVILLLAGADISQLPSTVARVNNAQLSYNLWSSLKEPNTINQSGSQMRAGTWRGSRTCICVLCKRFLGASTELQKMKMNGEASQTDLSH